MVGHHGHHRDDPVDDFECQILVEEVRQRVDEPSRRQLALQRREQRFFVEIRSEEHTSELQSLMRISYAVFCLKKKHIQPLRQHSIQRYITKHPRRSPYISDNQTINY